MIGSRDKCNIYHAIPEKQDRAIMTFLVHRRSPTVVILGYPINYEDYANINDSFELLQGVLEQDYEDPR